MEKRKFAITYNVFDATEHLEESINYVLPYVDYVEIVFQKISNIGVECNPVDLKRVSDIHFKYNIPILLYEPIRNSRDGLFPPAFHNEFIKRRHGFNSCVKKGNDYIMYMDTDEFFIPEEFSRIVEEYQEESIMASACQMRTYYKEKCYRIKDIEPYYVPLFYHKSMKPKFGNVGSPFLIDPTRGCVSSGIPEHVSVQDMVWRNWGKHEIMMHHMSYVRDDIRSKVENSSARVNFNEKIEYFIKYFNEWDDTKKALLMGKNYVESEVEYCNLFV